MPETLNKYAVGVQGNRVRIMLPGRLMTGISGDDAVLLAAYLVAMANIARTAQNFQETLAAVLNAE